MLSFFTSKSKESVVEAGTPSASASASVSVEKKAAKEKSEYKLLVVDDYEAWDWKEEFSKIRLADGSKIIVCQVSPSFVFQSHFISFPSSEQTPHSDGMVADEGHLLHSLQQRVHCGLCSSGAEK